MQFVETYDDPDDMLFAAFYSRYDYCQDIHCLIRLQSQYPYLIFMHHVLTKLHCMWFKFKLCCRVSANVIWDCAPCLGGWYFGIGSLSNAQVVFNKNYVINYNGKSESTNYYYSNVLAVVFPNWTLVINGSITQGMLF